MGFDAKKAKACTKKAVRRKFTPAEKGQTTVTRKNTHGQRSGSSYEDVKNSRSPEYSEDKHSVLKGEAVDKSAMKYEFNENGTVTERRMTRKEELNDIFQRNTRGGGYHVSKRMDRKGLEK